MRTVGVVLGDGGVRALWQGTGPSVLRVGLGAGLHFVLLEQAKLVLTTTLPGSEPGKLSAVGAALAGGGCECCSLPIIECVQAPAQSVTAISARHSLLRAPIQRAVSGRSGSAAVPNHGCEDEDGVPCAARQC